jgi:hypothetical protein
VRACVAFLLALTLGGVSPGQAAPDTFVYVSRHAFDCVLEHASDYESAPADPVVIVLRQCPPEKTIAAGDGVSMGAYPILPHPLQGRRRAATQSDTVLTLTRAQIACLSHDPDFVRHMIDPANPARYRIPIVLTCNHPAGGH